MSPVFLRGIFRVGLRFLCRSDLRLFQSLITGVKTVKGNRKADADFRRLEYDEDGVLACFEFVDDLVSHDDLSNTTDFTALHEWGMPHIGIVNFQAKAGW